MRRSNRRRPGSLPHRDNSYDEGVVPLMAPQDSDELKTQTQKGLYAMGCILAAFIVIMARLYFL